MNSLDGDRVFFRSPGHPRRPRAARAPGRRDRRAQGRRLRPGRRRDPRHRPGRRGDRAVRRHLAVRDDAGVRRRLAAGEDRHARLRRRRGDQQVRAPRRQGRAARRRPPAGPQPRGVRQAARRHAGLRHLGRHLQRRRRHRALPAPARPARRAAACRSAEGTLPPVDVRHSSGIRQVVPAERVRYLAEITETVRGYHAEHRASSPRRRAGCSGSTSSTGELADDRRRADSVRGAARAGAQASCPPRSRDQIDGWPAVVESYSGDEQVVRVRDKEIRTPLTRESLSGNKIPPRRAAPLHRPRRAGALLAPREPARATSRSPPASSRSSATARTRPGCSPARATRSAPTAASSCSRRGRGAPGCRRRSTRSRSTAATPTRAPTSTARSAPPGVSVATLDDMKVLYDGFDLVAPSTSRVDDDQRPGADRAGVLPQHRDRPAGRRVPRAGGPRARRGRARRARGVRAGERARHRAGRHPQGGPGPEHLPVLHRVLACG